jgi:ABC-type transport system substrate-binding protein
MVGDPAQAPYNAWEQSQQLDITEALFVMGPDGNPMTPYLADSWKVATDGSKVTIGLKKGIKWNTPPSAAGKDFGEFTADDVVWWLNRSNARTNPQSSSGDAGDFAAVFDTATAVDKYTVDIKLVSPVYFAVPLSEFGPLGAAPSVRSKAAFEQMGQEWNATNPVGTGPYVMKSWAANNRGEITAVASDHWNRNPYVQQVNLVQVPESTSAIAMLKSGQADISDLDFSLIPPEVKSGQLKFVQTMPDQYTTNSVLFSGNLYQEKKPISGEDLNPWTSDAYKQAYPWIGCPWGDRCPAPATPNPSGMDSMERARLVRIALNMAID